jgi:hypothetical protein
MSKLDQFFILGLFFEGLDFLDDLLEKWDHIIIGIG